MEVNMMARWIITLAALGTMSGTAFAQNPIQWSGNTAASIARAQEQSLPLMFWVSDRADIGDDDDLRDAQEQSFRDPAVVAIAHRRFVPVRVSRNSRAMAQAEQLGLPTAHGLYLALLTPSGELLDTIGPGEIADAPTLALRLAAASRTYGEALYERDLAPVIRDKAAPKTDVRRAVQKVWRLGILSADHDVAGLLARQDLTPAERARIYAMLASLATGPSVDTLLAAAAEGNKDAASALARAEAGALEFLVAELPGAEGEPTPRQLAAYAAATRITLLPGTRPQTFWAKASSEERARELDLVRRRAESVLAYWQEREGAER
jgi:hypothetical protein